MNTSKQNVSSASVVLVGVVKRGNMEQLHRVGDFVLLLCFYVTPVLVLVGLLGNSLAFSIFRRGMRRSASHFYFCVLALADSCTLISVFLIGAWFRVYLPEWIASESLALNATNFTAAVADGYGGVLLYLVQTLHRSPGCAIWYFVRLTSQTASVWLLVVFTFTRMMAVRRPLNAKRYTTVSSARTLAALTVLVSAAINLGVAIHDDCERRMSVDADELIELAFVSLIPSVLLLTMNCLILVTVYRGHQEACRLRKESRVEMAKLDAERQRLSGITQRLLAVSLCFILLEAPSFTFRLYCIFDEEARQLSSHTWISIDAALRFLSIINFSVNFILYCLTGKQFRYALLSMLYCRNPVESLVAAKKVPCPSYVSATHLHTRDSRSPRHSELQVFKAPTPKNNGAKTKAVCLASRAEMELEPELQLQLHQSCSLRHLQNDHLPRSNCTHRSSV